MCQPQYMLPFFSIGRLIYIKNNDVEWGWGIVINFTKKRLAVKKKKKQDVDEEKNEGKL